MKKFISTVLSALTAMSVFSVATVPMVSAADTPKATIHVSDFMGAAYDRHKTTQSQLNGKSTGRGDYQFEVGDLVNVTVSYQCGNPSAISGFMGYTFINQTTANATSSQAFSSDTSASNNTMVLSDQYYKAPDYEAGTYIITHTKGMLMAFPETASASSDAAKDKVAYTASIGAKTGMKISTMSKMVSFTVLIKQATDCYLYSAIEDAVDTTDDVNSVPTKISVKTTLEKVGHLDTSVATVSKSCQVNKGDVLVYNVKAKSSSKVGAFAITTSYNSSEFKLFTDYSKDGVNTIVASQGGKESVNTATAGKIVVKATAASTTPYDISSLTNLVTIKFVALKSGTFTVSSTLDSIVDNNNKPITYGGTKLTMSNTSSITVVDTDRVGAVSKSVFVKKGDVVVYVVKAKSTRKFQSYQMVTTYDKSAFKLYTDYSKDGVSTLKLKQNGTESVNTKTAGTITATVTAPSGSLYDAKETVNLEMVKLVALKDGTFTLSATIKSMKTSSGEEMPKTSVKFTNTSFLMT